MLGILSFEQIKMISGFCKNVIAQDEYVLFIYAINKNGRIIDMEKRDDSVLSALSKHESEIVFMQRILQVSMIRDLDEKLGKLSIAILERQYFTECLIPFYDGAVLIFFDSQDIRESAKKISQQVQSLDLQAPKIIC